MTFQPGANLYTQGFGSRPENVEVPHIDVRAPTTTDILYPVGKKWVDQTNNIVYELTSFSTSSNTTSANWQTSAGGSAIVSTLSGDTGTATPTAGDIKIAGTANQVSTSASGSTVTVALTGPYTPATYTAHGVLVGEGTSSIVALAVGASGTVLAGNTGADPAFTATPTGLTSVTAGSFITSSATLGTTFTDNTIIPTGSNANIDLLLNGKGTGAIIQAASSAGNNVNYQVTNSDNTNAASNASFQVATGGASAGDPYIDFLVSGAGHYAMGIDNSVSDNFVLAASGTLGTSNVMSITSAGDTTIAGAITSTVGNITATNGNLVLNTEGNKIVSTSVASTTTAGANSFGTVTLVGGTATVSTTSVTASSLIYIWRQSIGATGAAALGQLTVGTITASTSFVINAVQAADATALQASDVSVVGWMIVN